MATKSFSRKVLMLQMIPTRSKITSRTIAQRLESEGYPVSKRTVERDLSSLIDDFGVTCDFDKDQYGWSINPESRIDVVGSMGATEAAAYVIAERVLNEISPKLLLDTMKPMFNNAKKTLKKRKGGFSDWPKKIKIIPENMPLQKNPVPGKVVEAAFDALLNETKLQISYVKRGAEISKKYTISPLALIVKGPVFYLISRDDKDAIVKAFVLHRIKSCKETIESIVKSVDFDLENYVAKMQMNPRYQPTTLKLEAIIDQRIEASIAENKIADDQTLVERKDGTWLLKATIIHSYDFRRWLFSYIHHIRVLKPKRLVDEVTEDLRQSLANYELSPPALKSKMRV